MNIAILISGRIDFYKICKDINFQNFILPLQNAGHSVDIFSSIWECNMTNSFIEDFKKISKIIDIESFTPYTNALIENFNVYLELVKNYHPNDDFTNTMYFLYKLNRLFKMVEKYELVNNIKYDLFVRLRPEMTISQLFSLDSLNEIDYNSIIVHEDKIIQYIGNEKRVITNVNQIIPNAGEIWGCGDGWIDDNFCIAKKNVFKIICELYNNIIELSIKYKTCITHILLKNEFQKNNIKIIRPNFTFGIPRKDGIWEYFTHTNNLFIKI